MYRMIVVDDEAAITDWLEQTLSEHFGGMVEIYKAYSGEECLEIMAKGSFHILMTDISMPVISGLDLLSAVTEYYPKVKKLVLSAHDNFEFAKKAIDFEVSAYVLKSEGDKALFEAVERAIAEVEQQRELFDLAEKLKLESQKESAEKNSRLRQLLTQNGAAEANGDTDSALNLSQPMEMALLAIELKDSSRRSFLMMALEDSIAEFLKPHFAYELVETDVTEVILLAQFKPQSGSGSDPARFLKSPFVMYENAQEQFVHLTRQYINIIYSTAPVNGNELFDKKLRLRETLRKCQNFDCSIILPEDTAFDAAGSFNTPNGISREIGMVLKYISQNTDKDLSLIMLADVVYLNPSYLSHLFKQQVGMNLSEYIKVERIRVCREMLANPKYKIHEVASSVGYYNPSYFSRFFKKMTGVTPQEYRNSLSLG